MIKRPLVIYGAGGLGREVKTLVNAMPDFIVSGFCDDSIAPGTILNGVQVLGGMDYLLDQPEVAVVVAIGDPAVKSRIVERLATSKRLEFVTVVHPRALLGDISSIGIGEGTIITAGCILTTAINVGKHVLLNLNTTIGHDVTIGDLTSIMPGVNIAGGVSIGKRVLIGSGANVLNSLSINDDAIIGSGAVVRTNISAGATAVGVPAKEIKKNKRNI